ncbi:MAG: DUF5606 domain-containing protein [Clostridiales bacterium]|nr:DUF5606 domain-containing protein [Clostridiales bacterium]
MLKGILCISGRPGLFKLVNPGKNMLIVESLQTGKRTPAYAHDKVISLADISMYTTGDDVPLGDVLEAVKTKNDGKPVDIKAIGGNDELRAYFAEILPDFDDERVYTNDIKKLLNWYNQLLAAGIDSFKEPKSEETPDNEPEKAE